MKMFFFSKTCDYLKKSICTIQRNQLHCPLACGVHALNGHKSCSEVGGWPQEHQTNPVFSAGGPSPQFRRFAGNKWKTE